MGLDPITLGLGASLVGGLGGAIAGATGTPDQRTSNSSTSKTTFDPASAEERQLQQQSLQNYLQQMALGGQYEQGIGGKQGLQDQAMGAYGNVLSGQAFQMTPQEQAQLQALRGSMIDHANFDVNKMLDSRLSQLSNDAGARGLRGQAYSQLQGDALRGAADQMGNATRQANQVYAQQAINLPYQRLAAQNPYIQQGMSLADQMRLQAVQNRQTMQSPFLMQMLNNERMRSGTTTQVGNATQYGQEGSLLGALAGFMGGAGSGAQMGLGLAKTGKELGMFNTPSQQNTSTGAGTGAGYDFGQMRQANPFGVSSANDLRTSIFPS